MNPKAPNHKLTISPEGRRLKATCSCGKWVRTTPQNGGAEDRLKARYVDHVTGTHRL